MALAVGMGSAGAVPRGLRLWRDRGRGDIGGRESVAFLAPMGAHNAIAVEAWQVVAQWDLQTDDDDVVHEIGHALGL